ncbi:WYL domain-containing protein, partial [Salmonella enterica]|uniref:WYL domain-containing protein n=1 Tax=Salmonella enterica TaxID=28901 RepID=UPI003525735A
YASGTSDAVTERRVSPHHVLLADGRAYLEGYCHLVGARRTFRLDRILKVTAATGVSREDVVASTTAEAAVATLAVAAGSAWIIDVLGCRVVGTQPDGRQRVD